MSTTFSHAATTALLALLAACNATAPKAPSATAPPAPSPAATATATSGTQAPAPAPAPAAPLAAPIRTRNASFRSVRFDELPGWSQDDLGTAWDALRASCRSLGRRDDWKTLCTASAKVPRQPAAMRGFLEREFAPFQVLHPDATPDGEVTGYYEPLIAGSLRAEGPYTVPVYGVPNDLHGIDWKTIPAAQRRAVVHVMPQGRDLVVVPGPRKGSATLDAARFELDARDRRWRVRLDGGVARPYFDRAEIESRPRLDAPVVAWVDDALALYAMQVQGSGRILLRDGRVIRLQYAEQNGHPFKPLRLAARPAPRSRGLASTAEEPERFDLADALDDAPAPSASRSLKVAATPAVSDPSYVFFRLAADQSPSQGPVGAFGVPLTAGRSIAVDPRVVPLGYPVYLSTSTPAGAAAPLQRLVVAQDTGGAIRGAIRADFFWGFGRDAGKQALQTRERGQMWLLLPRGEAQALARRGGLTRSLKPGAVECLVPDDAHCSEPD
jgi:membrane-bound lytic murein transglycosylase A